MKKHGFRIIPVNPFAEEVLGEKSYKSLLGIPPEIQETKETPVLSNFEVPDEGIDYRFVINSMETSLILQTLRKTNWNKKQAAKLLNLKRTTLVEKIKKMKITPDMLTQEKVI